MRKNIYKIKNRKGLTFVELMISIAILTITITASTAVCVSYLKNRTAIKRYQENSEELSLAINQLSKEIRMSNCEGGGCTFSASSITLKNNSSQSSVTYAFNNNNSHELSRGGEVFISNVVGSFSVSPNVTDDSAINRITIVIMKGIKTGSSWENLPETAVQTTVSMRSGYNDTE